MRTEFFNRWVPLIAKNYWIFDRPLSIIVRTYGLWLGPAACMAVVVLILSSQRASAAWQFAQTLAVVTLIGLAVFFAQHKGWGYQAIPARFAFLGMMSLLIAEMGRPLGLTKLRATFYPTLNLVLGAALLATTVMCGAFVIGHGPVRRWQGLPPARGLRGRLSKTPRRETVYYSFRPR